MSWKNIKKVADNGNDFFLIVGMFRGKPEDDYEIQYGCIWDDGVKVFPNCRGKPSPMVLPHNLWEMNYEKLSEDVE